MNTKSIILTVLFLVVSSQLWAQRGYSSASVSMNRANSVVAADQVIVEEYINYHTHNIEMPKANEDIALSLDYYKVNDKELVLQVGLATKRMLDYSAITPINVCLVIDRSGSMSSDNKLEKVKNALNKFVKGLRPDDYLSIVAYSSAPKLVLAAQKFGQIPNVQNIIDNIHSGGSTNLHGGLMMGYEEVNKNRKENYNNKVVLLTDGIANVGVTEPEAIVKQSGEYNKQGIDVSTIGVGNDLNYALLQQIAQQGRGANHFVGNEAEDIYKVFEQELESLLSPIAKNVSLELIYPYEMIPNKVFGYAPEFSQQRINIPLNNINNGLTQVVLYQFKANKPPTQTIIAKLNYTTCRTGEQESVVEELSLVNKEHAYSNEEVIKSLYIAKMATSLKKMAAKVQNGEMKEGLAIINTSLEEVNKRFPYLMDTDLVRVKDILEKNKKIVDELIEGTASSR